MYKFPKYKKHKYIFFVIKNFEKNINFISHYEIKKNTYNKITILIIIITKIRNKNKYLKHIKINNNNLYQQQHQQYHGFYSIRYQKYRHLRYLFMPIILKICFNTAKIIP